MQGFSTIPYRKRVRGQKGCNMARTRVYLDWNATSPLLPAARQALVDALDATGNPSSIHAEGRRARARCCAALAVELHPRRDQQYDLAGTAQHHRQLGTGIAALEGGHESVCHSVQGAFHPGRIA